MKGPYSVGRYGAEPVALINRHNDGSMIIMGIDGEGYNCPALLVPMRVHPKRGEAWKTTDPEQEAFAEKVVAMLNADAAAGDLLAALEAARNNLVDFHGAELKENVPELMEQIDAALNKARGTA